MCVKLIFGDLNSNSYPPHPTCLCLCVTLIHFQLKLIVLDKISNNKSEQYKKVIRAKISKILVKQNPTYPKIKGKNTKQYFVKISPFYFYHCCWNFPCTSGLPEQVSIPKRVLAGWARWKNKPISTQLIGLRSIGF